jgi:hypothetical protein
LKDLAKFLASIASTSKLSIMLGTQAKPPQCSAGVSLACGQDVLPSLRIIPIVNILTDLILGEAIALLDFTFKLISFAVDGGKVVVGEISPFLFDLALHLLPVPFDAIPVHFDLRYENVLSKERSADRNVPVVAQFKARP